MCDSDYINSYRIQIQRIRDRKRTLREPLFATSVKLALLQFGGPVGLKIPTIPKMKSIFRNFSQKNEIKKGEIAILTLFFLPKSLAFGPEDIEAVVIEFETMANTVRFGLKNTQREIFKNPKFSDEREREFYFILFFLLERERKIVMNG